MQTTNTKLEDIGFYTLSDTRALNSSITSPLWRCEMILTDRCSFKCPYCRGLDEDQCGDMPLECAKYTLGLWIKDGLKNVRFSGGEPTLYRGLLELVQMCKEGGVERIAISTNGAQKFSKYEALIDAGVNDFSISLDADNAELGDAMAGGIPGAWQKVIDNIKAISARSYVTVGMVFNESNVERCVDLVLFADSLGVGDIRVIPSAQYDKALVLLSYLPSEILNKYPILHYRIKNLLEGKHVRGITNSPKDTSHKCRLVLDDMVVVQDKHYPCVIYMREHGVPIGTVGPSMRKDREAWMLGHTPSQDPICKSMCLDVCMDFNRKANTGAQ